MQKIERPLAGIDEARAQHDASCWIVRRVGPERADARLEARGEARDDVACRPALLQWRDRLRREDRPSPYRITRLR